MTTFSSCDGFRSELAAFLVGEQTAKERASLERHLLDCSACRDELEALRSTLRSLEEWKLPAVVEDPRAIAAAARAAARRPRRLRRLLPRIAAAAAAVLVLSLFALGAEIRAGNGELVLRVGLPGSTRAPSSISASISEPEMRRIAVEEASERLARFSEKQAAWFLGYSAAEERERVRLIQALDRVRAEDRQLFLEVFDSLATRNVQENKVTRDALVELATLVTPAVETDPNPR